MIVVIFFLSKSAGGLTFCGLVNLERKSGGVMVKRSVSKRLCDFDSRTWVRMNILI